MTHLLWGSVRWQGARGRDRGFSRGEAEALSSIWRRGEWAGSGAWFHTFGAGPARLGLLGEYGLAGRLGWGGGWRGESWGCREIKQIPQLISSFSQCQSALRSEGRGASLTALLQLAWLRCNNHYCCRYHQCCYTLQQRGNAYLIHQGLREFWALRDNKDAQR